MLAARGFAPAAAAVLAALLLLAAPAGAASSPLLRKADLPAGYTFDGAAQRQTDVVARFPTVSGDDDACYLSPADESSGPPARLDTITFTRNGRGTGGQSVWTFPKRSAAKAFFARYRRALERLPECTAVNYDDDDDDTTAPTPLGSYAALDVGEVGDARAAVVLEPAGSGAEPRTAVLRNGSRVVLVQVADPRLSPAEFRDLVMAADDRAG